MLSTKTLSSLLLGALSLAPGVAGAVSLLPGDIVVLGTSEAGSGLIQVDPVTGSQSLISQNGDAAYSDFAISPGGELFATTGDSVVRVDPSDGSRTAVSSGGALLDAMAIAAGADALYVMTPTGILGVDPVSGAQTPISSGGFIGDPRDLGLLPSGDLLALDTASLSGSGLQLFTVDVLSGDQTLVPALAGDLPDPSGLGIGPGGEIFVSDFSQRQSVLLVDPVTGATSEATGADLVNSPTTLVLDVAVDPTGALLVPLLVIGAPNQLVRAEAGGPGAAPLTPGFFDEVEVVPDAIVPEPSAAVVFAAGLLVAGTSLRRKRG
jgi:hypothetical protein